MVANIRSMIIPASTRSRLQNENGPVLPSMPPELISRVFCFLGTFSEALALAATSRQFQNAWRNDVNSISNHIAPRSIPCLKQARSFLAVQYGTKLQAAFSVEDVHRLVRNSSMMEQAILRFEKDEIPKIKNFNNEEGKRRPPILTHTERRRFIRRHYLLWEFLQIPQAKWRARLKTINLKQAYHLFEISRHFPYISQTGPQNMHGNSGKFIGYYESLAISEQRMYLERIIWAHIEDIHQNAGHDSPPQHLLGYVAEPGTPSTIVLWDEQQPSLRDIWSRTPSRDDEYVDYLWEESEDDTM